LSVVAVVDHTAVISNLRHRGQINQRFLIGLLRLTWLSCWPFLWLVWNCIPTYRRDKSGGASPDTIGWYLGATWGQLIEHLNRKSSRLFTSCWNFSYDVGIWVLCIAISEWQIGWTNHLTW
jgi:hypothetical protein